MKFWKTESEGATLNVAQLLREKLVKPSEIRPFPAAVARLMAALQESDHTSASLARIIERDPALAMRLLRMANSPIYGLSKEVRSVANATSILGTRALKSLAMSAAGAAMFSHGSSAAAERERLWKHSLIIPDIYVELVRAYTGDALVQCERQILETTHADVGFAAATGWNLAEDIKVAIGFHHRPADAPAHHELATMVYLANILAKVWAIGSEPRPEIETPHEGSLGKAIDFAADHLVHVREKAADVFSRTESD
jgi:HD-like signal output (HDOD) protein